MVCLAASIVSKNGKGMLLCFNSLCRSHLNVQAIYCIMRAGF